MTDPVLDPPRERRTPLGRILRLVAGWSLVGIGIIGLFVPILQGIALILLGLVILSRESARVRLLLRRFRRRHPDLDRRLSSIQDRLRRRRPGGTDEAAGADDVDDPRGGS